MAKIISAKQLPLFGKNLHKSGKKIVLVGGCFDVVHPGHIGFLTEAKKAGDILVVLLESDQNVRKLKGSNRPVHKQKMRAKVLSALEAVDCVLLLPDETSRQVYDQAIDLIKPDIIAVTRGYASIKYHKRAAKIIGARLKFVTNMIGNYSTSRILSYKDEN
ncbi:MAG: adenylyltransferase/cytidyltransferase family protein [Candidatus Daviesbacteria bacterium]|nr:adenylyltransferase/cytidyltransferase family protein [Candidatus Daviesbacteria bacterium]